MSGHITIDAAKCTNCMRCVEVCFLNFEDDGNGRARVTGRPDACFACGHCAAVCPPGAIANSRLGSLGFSPLSAQPAVSNDALLGLLSGRRSRREFKDEPVSRETIDKLTLAAAQAPNGINRRNVHYTVITDRGTLQAMSRRVAAQTARLAAILRRPLGRLFFRLFFRSAYRELEPLLPLLDLMDGARAAGKDIILYGAPCAILVHTPESDGATGCEDAVYAASNILAAAETLGLGACVIGFITGSIRGDSQLRRLAQLSADRRVHTTIIIGHPRFGYARAIARPLPPVHAIAA